VERCRWVFHVASPQAAPSEKDRTGGAVQGIERLMRAALGAPSVEKVVLTSSEAAIAYGHPRRKQHFTKADWTVLESPAGRSDYMRSKRLAEKLAWDLAVDPTINPRSSDGKHALARLNHASTGAPRARELSRL
jgi:dihydroflavonol-4-reductase